MRLLRHLPAARPRLLGGIAVGVVSWLVVYAPLAPATRFVLAWDTGLVAFAAMLGLMFARSTPSSMRFRAQREDASAWVILALVVAAAAASLIAIGGVLREAKETTGILAALHVALAGITIFLSWALTQLMFTLHYAHAWYGDPRGLAATGPGRAETAGGLEFPGNERHPDYGDFLYFSFVIGMTCQVSDVQVASRRMRRLTLTHGIVAFLFNTVILALTINLVAGLF